jgi:hypothetical protein
LVAAREKGQQLGLAWDGQERIEAVLAGERVKLARGKDEVGLRLGSEG